jgi:diadenosine tetraphosphatase ApaH/serine/threonine PP2A family protein phosphatase
VDQGPAFALFTECFNWIPLAAVLGRRVLVVHGGLFSRDDVKLDELRRLDRNQQPPDSGLMCEMMWSDPMPMPGRAPSKRGTALQFGPDVTKKFLALNGLGTHRPNETRGLTLLRPIDPPTERGVWCGLVCGV